MKQLTIVVSVMMFVMMAASIAPRDLLAAPETIEKTFALKTGGRVTIDLDAGGDVEIAGWAKDEVSVIVEIRGRDSEYGRVEFDEERGGLRIHSSCERRRGCRLDMNFTVKVPKRCDIRIESNGGDVEIEGVEGELRGKTMGGELYLADVAGKIDLETMGGSVTVRGAEADGEVSTMGGDILIEDVKGDLKGRTMGGKVTYRNVTGRPGKGGDKEVTVSTFGGDIVIDKTDQKVRAKTYGGDIDVGGGEEVNVTTLGGDINVDEAPRGAKVSTMGGDITIGSAGEYVKAKTMGGDIDIDAIDGRIEVSTMGGDVTATMIGDPKKGDRGVEISSMGGDITLTVPDGLSMKFDVELKYTKGKEGRYRIESDFPMDTEETTEWEGHWGNRHRYIYGTGTVGGGEHLIRIKTVNGNIEIRKG